MNLPDQSDAAYKREIVLDVLLTVFLCGLWNIVVQYHQCKALNHFLKEEKYSFWKFYFLSLLTCGVYYVYHEYRKAEDFHRLLHSHTPGEETDAILALVLAIFGFGWVYDAMLQSKLNRYINDKIALQKI